MLISRPPADVAGVYTEADIPRLKELMAEAGFRFRDEPGVMTTRRMACALGVSENHLRWLGTKGVVPKADRDHANRRKWRNEDWRQLRRAD